MYFFTGFTANKLRFLCGPRGFTNLGMLLGTVANFFQGGLGVATGPPPLPAAWTWSMPIGRVIMTPVNNGTGGVEIKSLATKHAVKA